MGETDRNGSNKFVVAQYPRLLSTVLDNLSEAVILHDASLKIAWANKAACQSMGLTPQDIVGLQCFMTRHQDTAFCAECPVRRAAKNRRPEEAIIVSADGDAAHMRCYPLLGEDGELQGVLEIAFEIIEHRTYAAGQISSRELCNTMIQQAPTYIVVLNAAGDILLINPTMLDHTGYTQKELLGRNYFTYFVMTDVQLQLQRDLRESAAARRFVADEHTVLTKDGGALTVNWYISPVFGEDGRLLYYFGIGVDVTERRRAESELHESQRMLSTLMSNLPGMAYRRANDRDWTMEFVSKGSTALTGYPPRDLTSGGYVSYASLIHPDDQAKVHDDVQRALLERRPFLVEYRIRTKEGATKWVWERGRGVFSTAGELLALEGIITDVSARREATEALVAEKERLEVTLRSIGEGVVTVDADGYITLFSHAARELTGWAVEDALGQPVERVFHAIDRQSGRALDFPLLMAMAAEDPERSHEVVLLARAEHERVAMLTAAPIHDVENRVIGLVLVFRDVTERSREQERRLRFERLEAVELLAGGIARVFDNLLAQSREELALARRKIGAPEEAHVHLGEVERILGSAGELTGRLLTFATGGRPTKTQLSLSPLIEQIAGEAADAADISWRLETADGLWPVEADEDQLRLVIRCFIDQFRERATDTLTLNLRLSNEKIAAGKKPPLPAGLYVHLLLHGPDQPPAMHLRSKMLEPDDLMRELGAELQLAIAHSIIHMHGGLVTVEAHPVVGTAYDIYLPARTPRTAREAAASRTRRRVLLMDDEELVVQMTGSLLDHLGYAFASSANGEQMLEQYAAAKERGEPFDVVILDLTVTRGMGGEKAIARLLALDPQARAIVTTGYADDIIMTDYAAYGFRGCLAKPFQIKDLTRVLEEILKD